MKIVNKSVDLIFPTPLYSSWIDSPDDLNKYISMIYADRDAGKGESNNRKHHWKSDDDYQNNPDWKDLCDLIKSEVNDAMDHYGVIRDDITINNMWAQIASHNNNHDIHGHPNSYFSGILYLQTPLMCGQTHFHRSIEQGIQPPLNTTDWNCGRWVINPEKGKLIIFPSWLLHSVLQGYEHEEDRITLAFTVMPIVNVKQRTAKYNYT